MFIKCLPSCWFLFFFVFFISKIKINWLTVTVLLNKKTWKKIKLNKLRLFWKDLLLTDGQSRVEFVLCLARTFFKYIPHHGLKLMMGLKDHPMMMRRFACVDVCVCVTSSTLLSFNFILFLKYKIAHFVCKTRVYLILRINKAATNVRLAV